MSQLNPEFYAPYNYTPKVPRARHNLSKKISTTLQTGLLTPVYSKRVYKGDDFKIRPMSLIQSIIPLSRQLYDCFELRFEYYLCPLSNYYGWMDNNSRNNLNDLVKLSTKWSADIFNDDNGISILGFSPNGTSYDSIADFLSDGNFVKPGSLLQTLGVPAGFSGNIVSDAGALPGELFNRINIERELCYLDIVRCYHLNTQYEQIPYTSGHTSSTVRPDSSIFDVNTFTHQLLDNLFIHLRYLSSTPDFQSNIFDYSNDDEVTGPTMQALKTWLKSTGNKMGGFFPVQYRPDLWRNLLSLSNTEVKSSVSVGDDGTINISEIRDKNILQKLYDSFYLSGGRYSNLLRTSFGMRSHHALKMPELLGVTRHLIDPSNITALAQTEGTDLGQKASNVDSFNKGKFIRVRPDVDSVLMVVASITPLLGYSQGFDPEVIRLSPMDDFWPELQGLSFDTVPRGFLSALPTLSAEGSDSSMLLVSVTPPDLTEVVGKSVKWMSERTDVNSIYGEFTPHFGKYDDMVLAKRYSQISYQEDSMDAGTLIDLGMFFENTPYVNPVDVNGVFANNDVLDPPFALHFSMNIQAKRPILKNIKPHM